MTMGRRPKPASLRKQHRLVIRVTAEQKAYIEKGAKVLGRDPATWCRVALLQLAGLILEPGVIPAVLLAELDSAPPAPPPPAERRIPNLLAGAGPGVARQPISR